MRFYLLKDGQLIASTSTHDEAVSLARQYQKLETHWLLKAEFSILAVESEEFVKYE